MRVTRKAICKAILERTGLIVSIFKMDGYFYFYSEDNDTALMLSSLESTSVYSNLLSHQSVDSWVRDFETIIKKGN